MLEPDDSITGRMIAAETVRLSASTEALPKMIDPLEGELWRKKITPLMDAGTVERALSETDRLGFTVLVSSDRD
jgi:DNA processing protein